MLHVSLFVISITGGISTQDFTTGRYPAVTMVLYISDVLALTRDITRPDNTYVMIYFYSSRPHLLELIIGLLKADKYFEVSCVLLCANVNKPYRSVIGLIIPR